MAQFLPTAISTCVVWSAWGCGGCQKPKKKKKKKKRELDAFEHETVEDDEVVHMEEGRRR